MVLGRIIKPKTQRVKRELEKRESKVFENDKMTNFIKGGQTNELVNQTLKELAMLKKPFSNIFRQKNILRPFDDETSIEFFAKKTDSSLFVFGSHQKKRPNNIVFGRLFDEHVLDMFEFGITDFKSMSEFATSKVMAGIKPCLTFTGQQFDSDPVFKRVKNILTDIFRGPAVTSLTLKGVEHLYQFFVQEDTVYMRSYKIIFKKSGSRTPRVELEEIGPSMNLVLRRSRVASDDLYKQSNKQPLTAKPKKKKNISEDSFGTKLGRIHMTPQDLDKLQTRKIKGLKKTPEGSKKKRKADAEAGDTTEGEGDTSVAVENPRKKPKKGKKARAEELKRNRAEEMEMEYY